VIRAVKRIDWPGEAAVLVSSVHVLKGSFAGRRLLDGKEVDTITAYLFHSGPDDNPATLTDSQRKCFIGMFTLGIGFTFDDTDTTGLAGSLSEMHELIMREQRNAERIQPYLGGEEVNDSPVQGHHRFVINFEDFPLKREPEGTSWRNASDAERQAFLQRGVVPLDYPGAVAGDWPDLLAIVEQKVRPQRLAQNDTYGQRYWWRFLRTRPDLRKAIRGLPRFLTNALHSTHLAFVFVPSQVIISHNLSAIALDSYASFATLQSRLHEIWTRFLASTLEDRIGYTPTDCFETFPFPSNHQSNAALLAAGQAYYNFRAELMVRNDEGLTKTYNRFHRPGEHSPDILKLRELHDVMDCAVLEAYGWNDHKPKCDFFPEFEDEEDDETESSRLRQRRYRYRWPDDIHDDVLARLLALNRERAGLPAAEETTPPSGLKKTAKRKKSASNEDQAGLY
jgi:hypothetical protein